MHTLPSIYLTLHTAERLQKSISQVHVWTFVGRYVPYLVNLFSILLERGGGDLKSPSE